MLNRRMDEQRVWVGGVRGMCKGRVKSEEEKGGAELAKYKWFSASGTNTPEMPRPTYPTFPQMKTTVLLACGSRHP
jgi:hypothetical protein